MKTETFDDPQAFLDALHGKRRAGAKTPRRAKGDGTGSRTSTLDTLARHGWTLIGYDHATGTHYALRGLTERHEAASYDALLDGLATECKNSPDKPA
jgi:hypothetical protein